MALRQAELVVEGPNDQHVIWALCEQYKVEETFSIEQPEPRGGIDALMAGIEVRLKQPGIQALGLVIDADDKLTSRWAQICQKLGHAGYIDLPTEPDPQGTIIQQQGKPRVGIWLMPNNQLPGMIEDFVAGVIIGADDPLRTEAERCLDQLEARKLNLYRPAHRAKAFIHTWLAWQAQPGQPMGTATTAHVLKHNHALAQAFVDWLNQLFNPD